MVDAQLHGQRSHRCGDDERWWLPPRSRAPSVGAAGSKLDGRVFSPDLCRDRWGCAQRRADRRRCVPPPAWPFVAQGSAAGPDGAWPMGSPAGSPEGAALAPERDLPLPAYLAVPAPRMAHRANSRDYAHVIPTARRADSRMERRLFRARAPHGSRARVTSRAAPRGAQAMEPASARCDRASIRASQRRHLWSALALGLSQPSGVPTPTVPGVGRHAA